MAEILLIGSGNRDKAHELARLLDGLPWNVKGLNDFDAAEEPEETEDTFEGNALLKARHYGARHGVACVADDSGLEVDALGGAPGVYSARYAGPGCSYGDNNQKLLQALADTPPEKRQARFVCCAAFAGTDGVEKTFRGTVEGTIRASASGANGFGYDPVFQPEGKTETFAEMAREEKQAISHRGRAFRAFRAWLEARA